MEQRHVCVSPTSALTIDTQQFVALVLGQIGRGQNGTDKMVPIESSINQAIQLPLTI